MGYKCTFMDNEVYSAKDVNAMFANLTSEGIALVDSGNVLSDLNTAVSEVTSEGVQLFVDSCKLTKTDGVYKIGEGVCFMPDGSTITFDSDGYEISPVSGVKNYVYLKRNETMNRIDVIVSQTAGGDGTVPIAEIGEGGAITDTRKFSKAKVKLNQLGNVEQFSLQMYGLREKTIDVGRSDFSRIILNNVLQTSTSGTQTKFIVNGNNVMSISDGETLNLSFHIGVNYSNSFEIQITKSGSVLTFGSTRTVATYSYLIDFEIIT